MEYCNKDVWTLKHGLLHTVTTTECKFVIKGQTIARTIRFLFQLLEYKIVLVISYFYLEKNIDFWFNHKYYIITDTHDFAIKYVC